MSQPNCCCLIKTPLSGRNINSVELSAIVWRSDDDEALAVINDSNIDMTDHVHRAKQIYKHITDLCCHDNLEF